MEEDIESDPENPTNIDIKNLEQRYYWCKQLNCTLKELAIAEYTVGPNILNIKKYLSRHKIWKKNTTI
ncbi:MAG: DUF3606 domain-containing protein [Cyclobacteriaceae bacterium]|nr:DUF3606 domain-containing protein [Cyclobacteriaceae bacterium]